VTVTSRAVKGKPGLIPSQYRRIHEDVKKADPILLDDGNLSLEVNGVRDRDITCTVVHGGRLKDRKGLNLPFSDVSVPTLTRKDRADARFAIGLDIDYLALSFVRSAKCVESLRRLIKKEGEDTHIIAKIEKPQALDRIDEILAAADAVMIARGDLGVEMPVEEVPLIQNQLVRVAKEANRPVIMATQMLESMIDNARPTRAEVTDVANSAQLGADAVMLSAETAVGAHPVAAVETMDRVLRLIEGYQWKHGQFGKLVQHGELPDASGGAPLTLPEALSRATSLLSRGLAVRAIVVPSNSGRTALWVSSERPAAPVFCFSDKDDVLRRATLWWGVSPHKSSRTLLRDPPALARWALREMQLADPGQTVLLVWDTSPEGSYTPPQMTAPLPAARRRRFRLAAVLLPIVALGIVEVGLRIAGFEHDSSAPRYLFLNPEAGYAQTREAAMEPDPELFWRLRPGLTGVDGTQFVKLTGFRSDFAPEPAPGTRRIACIGDSNTFGLQVPEDRAWPAVTESMLRAEGRPAEVLNLGVPGYTSHQGLVLLRTQVLALRPDVVVCAFGVFNDWIPARGRTDAEQHSGSSAPALRVVQAIGWLLGKERPAESFELADLLDNIDTRDYDGPRRVDPGEFEGNLRAIVETSRESGADVVLLASPLPDVTLERNPIATEYAETMRRVGQAAGVPVVDGWALFATSGQGGAPLFADFCHPSARGHALLGHELARVLAPRR
jgi:pyruvate kinase